MSRIVAFALSGWAGIVGLAWWLANRRIGLCHWSETDCIVRATATRDYVLIAGLAFGFAVALSIAVVMAAAARRRQASGGFTHWRPARRADRPLLP